MAALLKDRSTSLRDGVDFSDPVAAGVKVYAGALVALDAAGHATPGAVSATLKARGIAQEQVDNTAGIAGDLQVRTRRGVFHLGQDGSISRVDIGNPAYIVDDQTVADNNGTNTRSLAGTIKDVDVSGVWIEIA